MRVMRLTDQQLKLAAHIRAVVSRWETAVGTGQYHIEAAQKLLAEAQDADLPEVAWFALQLQIFRDGEPSA